MLVKCPSVLLVNSAVIPIIHVCSAEFPISFAEENDRTLGAVKQQPGCVVNHLSVFPEVTTHVHILGSLSPGHSPLSSRSLQIKSTLAKAAHMDYKMTKGSHIRTVCICLPDHEVRMSPWNNSRCQIIPKLRELQKHNLPSYHVASRSLRPSVITILRCQCAV